ncbi:MAG: ABC transporter permease [Trueperaceae bacterium]|nr:ABC transporter permease [Trueperaceae bacterium]
MTEEVTVTQGRRQVPVISLIWLGLAVLLLVLSFFSVPLKDARFAGESASLAPNFWLPTLAPDTNSRDGMTLISVGAIDTGIPFWILAFVFAGLELWLARIFAQRDEKLIRPLFRAATVFLAFWSFFGHLPLWDALLSTIFPRSPQILYPRTTVIELTAQHLELVIVSSVITIGIGLALGIMVTRAQFREFLPLVSDFVNAGQTVPTLGIVAIMVPIIGLGFWPAIVALILYGMLPVVRNAIAGLEAVDPFVIDSARGMGMTPSQILWQIELPNASRIILAGIRTSVVINIGTAALGAYAGSGGLGVPIAGGLSQTIFPFVLLGALPAALLAILIDYVLERIEFVLTPKGLQIEK